MDERNLDVMDLIDRQYLDTPFYGRPKMTAYLRRLGNLIEMFIFYL